MASVNDTLQDAAIRHAVWLERLGGSTANKVIKLLDDADRDILRKIEDRLDRLGPVDQQEFGRGLATTKRLQKIRDEIRVLNRDVHVAVGRELSADMQDLAEAEIDIASRRLNEAVGIDLNNFRPSPELLRSLVTSQPMRGRILRDWVKDLESAKLRELTSAIQLGLVEGETTPQIIRRIRGTRAAGFRDGILQVSRRRATVLARTAINHYSTQAREMLYAANGDVIDRVMWLSVLDGSTSAICRARSRMTFKVGEGPRPPAHPACRATTVPVTKSWEELSKGRALKPGRGARDIDTLFRKRLKAKGFKSEQIATIKRNTQASMNGAVPADLSYAQWLRTQPREFIVETLGPTRAKLFLDGKLEMSKFVDMRTGRPFTIDELRAKESRAFMRADLELDEAA